ncbi:MAG TPA: hypothetical protein VH478_04310 [Trebonia sp.]|jgi:hypothetical protein|nr:hypothetical protein [Trebonia sp.]
MEPEETATIVRLVKSVFPQQPIDRATYETWHLVIGHLDVIAAQHAVISIAHSETFCAAADIIREAGRAAKAHPSDRTVAEALEHANRRALGAADPAPPSPAYVAAKDQMMAKMRERDEAAYLASREAQQRAQAWIDYKLTGKLPPEMPQEAPPAPRWTPLPGDPPELRAWLASQPPGADGPS